jgi:molybdopterin converting factor small subunit
MRVLIPTPLQDYTRAARVEAAGATLGEVLADLERQFPGIRFRMVDEQGRIRRHMRCFAAGQQLFDLDHRLDAVPELLIVQALSGG